MSLMQREFSWTLQKDRPKLSLTSLNCVQALPTSKRIESVFPLRTLRWSNALKVWTRCMNATSEVGCKEVRSEHLLNFSTLLPPQMLFHGSISEVCFRTLLSLSTVMEEPAVALNCCTICGRSFQTINQNWTFFTRASMYAPRTCCKCVHHWLLIWNSDAIICYVNIYCAKIRFPNRPWEFGFVLTSRYCAVNRHPGFLAMKFGSYSAFTIKSLSLPQSLEGNYTLNMLTHEYCVQALPTSQRIGSVFPLAILRWWKH